MDFDQEREGDAFNLFGELDEADLRSVELPESPPDASAVARPGFFGTGALGRLAALGWAAGAAALAVSYYGADALRSAAPAAQITLAAVVFGPALLIWLAASAAAEAWKTRRLVRDLARAVSEAQATSGVLAVQSLGEAATDASRRIVELDALARDALEAARVSAQTLHQERDALRELKRELNEQTESLARSVSRQVRLLREASKLVGAEVTAAEEALQNQLGSFTTMAAVMSERTVAFQKAAESASAATESLNGVMGSMLEGLAEATRLADAARQSSEHAVVVANNTANAVRETTRAALHEAKCAAQFIRSEAQSLSAPVETLVQLQQVAVDAHAAAGRSEAAAGRHAAAAGRVRQASASPETRRTPFGQARVETRSWNGFTAPQTKTPAPANDEDASLVEFARPRHDADAALKREALGLLASAGVDADRALRPEDLDEIALRSRHGAAARRNAVLEIAPEAVNKVARHLNRNPSAQAAAVRFRRRPDLTRSERKSECSVLVRAYLLVDAALG